MLERSEAEIRADEVMGWVETAEYAVKVGHASEWSLEQAAALLDHLHEMHRIRDREIAKMVHQQAASLDFRARDGEFVDLIGKHYDMVDHLYD